MEQHITLFMVLFMQASAVSWLCLSTVQDSLRRPAWRIFLAFLPVNAAFSVVYSFVPAMNAMAVVVVTACGLAGWFYLARVSDEHKGKLLFVLMISAAHLLLSNTVWLLLCNVVGLFTPYSHTAYYNILILGLPLALFMPVFARMLKTMWRDAAGLALPWYRLAMIPIAFTIIYIAIYVLRSAGHDDALSWHIMMVVITACFFITCSQLFFGLNRAAQAARYAESLRMAEGQIEQQSRRFSEIAEHNREMKRLRHNARQHAGALYALLAEKKYKSAMEYATQFAGEVEEIAAPPLCDNEAVDAALRYYLARAQKCGVEAKLAVVLPREVGIPNTALCVLLGNLLENAIEACARMPKSAIRWLELRVTFRENQLLISLRNSFGGQANAHTGGTFRSEKTPAGGLGLPTIQVLAERYGGRARFYTEGPVFISEVLMFGTDATGAE